MKNFLYACFHARLNGQWLCWNPLTGGWYWESIKNIPNHTFIAWLDKLPTNRELQPELKHHPLFFQRYSNAFALRKYIEIFRDQLNEFNNKENEQTNN